MQARRRSSTAPCTAHATQRKRRQDQGGALHPGPHADTTVDTACPLTSGIHVAGHETQGARTSEALTRHRTAAPTYMHESLGHPPRPRCDARAYEASHHHHGALAVASSRLHATTPTMAITGRAQPPPACSPLGHGEPQADHAEAARRVGVRARRVLRARRRAALVVGALGRAQREQHLVRALVHAQRERHERLANLLVVRAPTVCAPRAPATTRRPMRGAMRREEASRRDRSRGEAVARWRRVHAAKKESTAMPSKKALVPTMSSTCNATPPRGLTAPHRTARWPATRAHGSAPRGPLARRAVSQRGKCLAPHLPVRDVVGDAADVGRDGGQAKEQAGDARDAPEPAPHADVVVVRLHEELRRARRLLPRIDDARHAEHTCMRRGATATPRRLQCRRLRRGAACGGEGGSGGRGARTADRNMPSVSMEPPLRVSSRVCCHCGRHVWYETRVDTPARHARHAPRDATTRTGRTRRVQSDAARRGVVWRGQPRRGVAWRRRAVDGRAACDQRRAHRGADTRLRRGR